MRAPRWLRQGLGRREIPDAVCQELSARDYFVDLETAERSGDARRIARERERLLEAAELLLAGYARGAAEPRGERTAPPPGPVPLGGEASEGVRSALVAERAAAFSALLAADAAQEPAVRRFREAALGHRLLTPTEAWAFVRSPALAWFSAARLRRRGVPLIGHEVADQQRATETLPDGRRRWHLAVRLADPPTTLEGWAPAPHPVPTLAYPAEDRWVAHTVVAPGSVLDELRRVVEGLVEGYPWPPAAATWYVLTGAAPWVAPIRVERRRRIARRYARSEVALIVESWVPAAEVVAAYRSVQRQLLGGDNRPLGRRALALARFLAGQPPDLRWRELMERWNAAYPAWRFDSYRRFAEAAARAERAIRFARS